MLSHSFTLHLVPSVNLICLVFCSSHHWWYYIVNVTFQDQDCWTISGCRRHSSTDHIAHVDDVFNGVILLLE